MYEDDLEYASKRLNGTLVRLLNGTPFMVSRTYQAETLRHLGQNMLNEESVDVAHNELDLEPVPLGFVNATSGMVYVCRKPMRRDWRQGLSANSIKVYGHIGGRDLHFKLLNQPILKQYPSFKVAYGRVNTDKKESTAFSRDFGLRKVGGVVTLFYKQYPVGVVTDGVPVLDLHRFGLEQHLSEAMG